MKIIGSTLCIIVVLSIATASKVGNEFITIQYYNIYKNYLTIMCFHMNICRVIDFNHHLMWSKLYLVKTKMKTFA